MLIKFIVDINLRYKEKQVIKNICDLLHFSLLQCTTLSRLPPRNNDKQRTRLYAEKTQPEPPPHQRPNHCQTKKPLSMTRALGSNLVFMRNCEIRRKAATPFPAYITEYNAALPRRIFLEGLVSFERSHIGRAAVTW